MKSYSFGCADSAIRHIIYITRAIQIEQVSKVAYERGGYDYCLYRLGPGNDVCKGEKLKDLSNLCR